MDMDYEEDFSLSQRMASDRGQGAVLDSQTASVNWIDYPEKTSQPLLDNPTSGGDAMDFSGLNGHPEVRRRHGKVIRCLIPLLGRGTFFYAGPCTTPDPI